MISRRVQVQSVPRSRRARPATDQTLAETVFEQLKREIVDNRLKPDSVLTELSVAAAYSVSRAPAREALKRLAALGFVRPLARVGYMIANVSVADLDEVFAMRIALEPMATELAVGRMTETDAAALQKLADAVLHLDRADKHSNEHGRLVSKLNADFHREIARIAGNRRLEQTVGRLLDELERVMHMLAYSTTVRELLDEHSQLLRVMRSGDAAKARDLMRAQLMHDYSVMRKLVVEAPSGMSLVRSAAVL